MLLSLARLYQALEISHSHRKPHRLVKETHSVSRGPLNPGVQEQRNGEPA